VVTLAKNPKPVVTLVKAIAVLRLHMQQVTAELKASLCRSNHDIPILNSKFLFRLPTTS
jgi:hypothetical protein